MTDDPEPLRSLSHSEYRSFKVCRRNWCLTYYAGFGRRDEDEPLTGNRELGLRVHLALEGYYGHHMDPIAVLHATYDELAGLHPEALTALNGERGYAVAMVKGYLDWAAEEGTDAEYEVIATETDTSHRLQLGDGREVLLRGHLDQVVRRRGGDESLLLRDFKTVGSLARGDELRRDEQLRFYALLQWLNAESTGDRVDGVLYTMLLRSKRTVRARPPFYQTIQVRYNVNDQRSMLHRVTAVAVEIGRVRRQLDLRVNPLAVVYPTPGPHCSWCPFAAICPLFDDGSRADAALYDNFQRVDPYGYYGTARIDHVKELLAQSE